MVGDVPAGLPAFGVPDVSFEDLKTLLPAAVGIAFVAFTDTSVLSRSYAGRLRQEVDQNQELAVLGVANIATGFFQGFPISTSSSRTAVAEDVGARSQLAGLAGAGVLALLLIFGTGLVHDLPLSTLAAIVIVAVLGFIDVVGRAAAAQLATARSSRLRWWRSRGVAVLGVLWGVGIAIALSLLNFIRRAWRPHDAVLGRVDNLKGYHDTERHPDARRIPGLVLYRFDAPLFFANADYFRERVRALARAGDVSWIVVAAEPITDIDATAGETLRSLNDELEAAGIELAFAELKDPVRDWLRRYGIHDAIGDHRFFPTIGVAVAAYLDATGSTGSTGRTASLTMTRLPAADVDGRPPALVRTLQPMSRGVSPKYAVYSAVVSAVSVTQMLRAALLTGEPSGPFAPGRGRWCPCGRPWRIAASARRFAAGGLQRVNAHVVGKALR